MNSVDGKAYFGRRYQLSASHRLHSDALTDAENAAAYGKCNNPHGHGHNYVLEVLVGGAIDPETGMVLNLAALDETMQKRVMERFDHTNLNLDSLFQNRVPTTENLCKAVFELLDGEVEPAKLVQIRVEETENNFFEYMGEEEQPQVLRLG
jgi:6-pyruvoyltetrahydropterin/6-carboxytetrahydropterin synthase